MAHLLHFWIEVVMKIRQTDLMELVLQINTDLTNVLKELLINFSINLKTNEMQGYLSSLKKSGSQLIGEGLNLKLQDKQIQNCSIWIRRDIQKDYLIEINFVFKDIEEDYKEYLEYLKEFSFDLARKYSINKFYCGLEPADDIDNQYFTNNGYGLLFNELAI